MNIPSVKTNAKVARIVCLNCISTKHSSSNLGILFGPWAIRNHRMKSLFLFHKVIIQLVLVDISYVEPRELKDDSNISI